MTVPEAVSYLLGDISAEEFDISKGVGPKRDIDKPCPKLSISHLVRSLQETGCSTTALVKALIEMANGLVALEDFKIEHSERKAERHYEEEEEDECDGLDFWDITNIYKDSDLGKKEIELDKKIERTKRLDQHVELIPIKLEWLSIQMEKYNFIVELSNEKKISIPREEYDYDWYRFGEYSENLIRSFVVTQNNAGVEKVLDLARSFSEKTGFDTDVFEHEMSRFINDAEKIGRIYDLIKSSPGVVQKKVYKELSLEGRKCVYIFDYAEKLGKISRTKTKDSWELNLI